MYVYVWKSSLYFWQVRFRQNKPTSSRTPRCCPSVSGIAIQNATACYLFLSNLNFQSFRFIFLYSSDFIPTLKQGELRLTKNLLNPFWLFLIWNLPNTFKPQSLTYFILSIYVSILILFIINWKLATVCIYWNNILLIYWKKLSLLCKFFFESVQSF